MSALGALLEAVGAALAHCGEWLDGLPQRRRPGGAVAGKVRTSPVGRPAKVAEG
jgi:hypothetical protein